MGLARRLDERHRRRQGHDVRPSSGTSPMRPHVRSDSRGARSRRERQRNEPVSRRPAPRPSSRSSACRSRTSSGSSASSRTSRSSPCSPRPWSPRTFSRSAAAGSAGATIVSCVVSARRARDRRPAAARPRHDLVRASHAPVVDDDPARARRRVEPVLHREGTGARLRPGSSPPRSIAVWVAAWLADTFAFRFDALIEAIVPTAGVFLFVSVLARPDYRLVSCRALPGSLSSRSSRCTGPGSTSSAPGWLARQPSSVAPTVLRTTSKVGRGRGRRRARARARAARRRRGATLGPRHRQWRRHPRDAAARSSTSGAASSTRPTESRFTVASPTPSYWRLTALDTFDGKIWSSESNVHRRVG